MNPAELIRHGLFDQADDALSPLSDINAEAAFLLGGLRQWQGDIAASERLYLRALELNPGYVVARNSLDALRKGLFFPWGKGLLGTPVRHGFMAAAVALFSDLRRPLEILEVGSYVGSSLLTWASAAGRFLSEGAKIMCVDVWDRRKEPMPGEVTFALSRAGVFYDAFVRNSATVPSAVRVEHRKGYSRDVLPTLTPGSFDLVYVDGSHLYRDVLDDLKNADCLVRANGIVCGDDLELQIDDCDPVVASENMDADQIRDPRTGIDFHPGVTLAVNEFFGPVSGYAGFWLMRKTATGYEAVTLEPGSALTTPHHWPALPS